MKFVLGFYFSEDRERVLLMMKNRPHFLKGKFNGVGGKVEPGERERMAMIREFKEECDIDTWLPDWHLLGIQEVNEADEIFVFYGFGDLSQAKTMTDEVIHVVDVHDIANIRMDDLAATLINRIQEKFTPGNHPDKIELP